MPIAHGDFGDSRGLQSRVGTSTGPKPCGQPQTHTHTHTGLGGSHQPVHTGKVTPEVPCPVRRRHLFGINHDGVGLAEQRGQGSPGALQGPGCPIAWGHGEALTSRKREMSLLSLTPMATTFSKSQKKGRSSPSLGRASCRRR